MCWQVAAPTGSSTITRFLKAPRVASPTPSTSAPRARLWRSRLVRLGCQSGERMEDCLQQIRRWLLPARQASSSQRRRSTHPCATAWAPHSVMTQQLGPGRAAKVDLSARQPMLLEPHRQLPPKAGRERAHLGRCVRRNRWKVQSGRRLEQPAPVAGCLHTTSQQR